MALMESIGCKFHFFPSLHSRFLISPPNDPDSRSSRIKIFSMTSEISLLQLQKEYLQKRYFFEKWEKLPSPD